MIRFEKISKTYSIGIEHNIQALKDISFKIDEGEMVGLIGSSGSGKSTLLNILGCLDVPDSGAVYFNEENIISKTEKEKSSFRNNNIGFIFQSYNLIPSLNVYENIEFPFLISSKKKYENRDAIIREMVEQVGLTRHILHRSNQLSGGQMQRVAIARALVLNPVVVLADEPTANIDTETSVSILDVMKRINEQQGTTFIIASHDPLVKPYMHRRLYLKDGKIE